MRLLLDTHIALWAITDDHRLPVSARALVEDRGNDVFFSVATLWEIAIKHGSKPTEMPVDAREARGWFGQAGYRMLDIRPEHIELLGTLPPLHRDPFDRLLVVQALAEPLRLVTHDSVVAQYGLTVLAV